MVDLSIVMLVYQRVTLQKMEVSSSILPSKLQRCAIFSAMCQGLEGLFTLVGQVGEYLPWWSECWLTCNGLLFLMNTYIYICIYLYLFIIFIYYIIIYYIPYIIYWPYRNHSIFFVGWCLVTTSRRCWLRTTPMIVRNPSGSKKIENRP